MIRTSCRDQATQKGGTRVPPFFFQGAVTLVELVMVMVIVSVLASVAFLTYRPTPIKARYQAERLRTDLRHAQMLGLTENLALRVTVTAGLGGSYAVSSIGGVGTGPCTTASLTDPATNAAFSVTLDSTLTLAGTATVDLDSLGRPASCSGNPCACSVVTASNPVASYTVTGGGSTYTVELQRVSGFVTITP